MTTDQAKDTTYNGYPNRATWNANLWIMNDEPMYRAWQAEGSMGKWTAGRVRMFLSDMLGEATPDGDKIRSVRAGHLAKSWNDNR